MKKAINTALLAAFVLIAELACTQTVATNSNGLFLSTNNSASAQNYINATRTDAPSGAQQINQQPENQPADVNQQSSLGNASIIENNPGTSSRNVSSIDERSIPLFTKEPASGPAQLQPIADSIGSTLSLVTSLFALIVAALAVSWFIQKKTGIAANNFGKVLGFVPLDNKRIIYIVDVMGKMLVLGVTESNINFLTEITDKDTIDAYRLKYGQSVTPGLDKLFPFLKRNNSEETEENDTVTEEKSKREANKQISDVKMTLDNSHDKRIARLKDMLIKK